MLFPSPGALVWGRAAPWWDSLLLHLKAQVGPSLHIEPQRLRGNEKLAQERLRNVLPAPTVTGRETEAATPASARALLFQETP